MVCTLPGKMHCDKALWPAQGSISGFDILRWTHHIHYDDGDQGVSDCVPEQASCGIHFGAKNDANLQHAVAFFVLQR